MPAPVARLRAPAADAGGASKAFLHHITDAGLQYSIGFPAQGPVQAAIQTIPEQAWVAALDSDGTPREGAQVAELTNWMPTPVKPTRSPAKYGPQEWPAASSAPAAGDDSGYPETGPGTTSLTPAGPACALPKQINPHTHRPRTGEPAITAPATTPAPTTTTHTTTADRADKPRHETSRLGRV